MANQNVSISSGELTSPFSVVNSTSAASVPDGCVLNQGPDVVLWNEGDGLMPQQVEVIVNILFNGICMPLCFPVSLCCNTMNMIVFYKHGLKERINMLLFTLSLMDFINVAVVSGHHSDVLYMVLIGRAGEIRPAQAFFFNNFLLGLIGAGTASQIVSSLIALERCLCITRPLLVKNLMSTQKTALVLWPILLLLVAGVFVDCMRYTVGCVFDANKNYTYLQIFPREFDLQDHQFIYDLASVLYGAVLPSFCVTCVTMCTVIIVVKMKKLSSWRETVSSVSDSLTSRDLTLTRMIVGTSVLFIVCIIPSMAVRIPVIIVPELNMGQRYEKLYSVMLSTFFLSSVINSTLNFFVYYAYGTKFRQTVLELFCSRCYCKKTEGKLKESGH